jgi:hypothetical protein
MRIQEAARRYVHEQAPTPPVAVLERVARIVLQARTTGRQAPKRHHPASTQPSVMQGGRRAVAKGAA